MEINIDALGNPVSSTIQNVLNNLQQHIKVVDEITEKWKRERLDLQPGTVILYHDFTTIHECTKRKVLCFLK